jgi:small-conductance mechanosensitive channel
MTCPRGMSHTGSMSQELMTLWREGPWLHLGAWFVIAALLAILLGGLIRLLVRRLRNAHPVAADMMRRASAPLLWLLPLLMLALVTRPGAPPSLAMDILHHLIVIALVASITWAMVRCIGVVENVAIRRHPVDVADNLEARRVVTQVKVLGRTAEVIVVVRGLAAIMMTIPGVRQVGASLLASAGVAGLALGLAAKPVLSNLLAGLQIALTQPIRLDDVVIIEGEWGRIEEITGSYVVVRIWDERRLVVPLNWFMENPFQNWTRASAELIGTVFLWMDYRVPLAALREELKRLCAEAEEWDGRVCLLQVTDTSETAIQLRALVSSADSGRNWDLRCRIREGLLAFVQTHHPEALPRWRGELESDHPQPELQPAVGPEPQKSPSPEDGGPLRAE